MKKLPGSLVAFALIALSVSIFSNIPTSSAAFGTSPPWVRNDHLLPGATFEEVIYLSRNEPEEAVKATIRVSGDEDLAEWIKIPDEENLIMEKGQTILPMTVIINVPERAAIKDYTGGIFVSIAPLVTDTSLGGGGVAIGLGAHISVDLSVIGDKITDYEIKSASAGPQKEDDPFSVNVEVKNKGNTEISDLEGQIDISNSTNTEILESFTFIPFDEPVAPDETKKIEMVFQDFKPGPGEYWVAVRAFKDGEVIYEDRFLQKVEGEVIPVQPPLAKVAEETAVTPPATQVPASDVKPAAPAASEAKNVYLLLGLTGLSLVLAALIGIIMVIRRKGRGKENSLEPKDSNFERKNNQDQSCQYPPTQNPQL